MHSIASVSPEERIKDYRELQKAGLICLDDDFFPSVHYPPITMYHPITQEELFKGYENPEDKRFDVYAHIPFCKKCCVFCHYPNKFGDKWSEEKDFYLSMMEKEIDIYLRVLGLDRVLARSILIGGGTPTYLTPAQLERFLRFFTAKVDTRLCTQFNYDVDPQTLLGTEGKQRLELLKSFGVDRLTIGVQALNSDILQRMNRHHSVEEAVESVHVCKEMGFQINIEFIFGYPGQTLDIWRKDIEKAVTLGVEEIQLYRLKVIPYGDQTGVITKKFAGKRDDFVPVDETIRMKQTAMQILAEHGYLENLRRVFTRDKRHFSHYAHNQCCNLFDEIGFGLTAFSSLRDRFGLNTQYFEEYYSLIQQGRLPLNRGLVRSKDDQMRWSMVLPLKNREVYKKRYFNRTGLSLDQVFRNKIEKLKKCNLVIEDDKVVKLTPLGAFFADEVCLSFHNLKYMPFSESAFAPGELNPYHDYFEFPAGEFDELATVA